MLLPINLENLLEISGKPNIFKLGLNQKYLYTVNVLKFEHFSLSVLKKTKALVFSAGIHKMFARIANREDPDQTSSEAV